MIDRVNECEIWLKDFLGRYPGSLEHVRESAKEEGFKKAELKQARKNLGVKLFTFNDEGVISYFWHIPKNQTHE